MARRVPSWGGETVDGNKELRHGMPLLRKVSTREE
jgi:hypothetical protein